MMRAGLAEELVHFLLLVTKFVAQSCHRHSDFSDTGHGFRIAEWTATATKIARCPHASRPGVPCPSAKGYSKTLVGVGADAGELETDSQSERAHDEMAGREAAKPLGHAGLCLVRKLKEDEPWLVHVAVPAGQGGRPVLHQVREGQKLRWRLCVGTLRVSGFRRSVFRNHYFGLPRRGVYHIVSHDRTPNESFLHQRPTMARTRLGSGDPGLQWMVRDGICQRLSRCKSVVHCTVKHDFRINFNLVA